MLLTCSSCNSKYLVNSADLKPDGKNVKCAVCGHNWFQNPDLDAEETLDLTNPNSQKAENNQLEQKKSLTHNLPSTYIKEEKVNLLNSFLAILFLVIFVVLIWFIKKEGNQIITLFNYYIQEFYFSLKLIINDLAKLMHQIIN